MASQLFDDSQEEEEERVKLEEEISFDENCDPSWFDLDDVRITIQIDIFLFYSRIWQKSTKEFED